MQKMQQDKNDEECHNELPSHLGHILAASTHEHSDIGLAIVLFVSLTSIRAPKHEQ